MTREPAARPPACLFLCLCLCLVVPVLLFTLFQFGTVQFTACGHWRNWLPTPVIPEPHGSQRDGDANVSYETVDGEREMKDQALKAQRLLWGIPPRVLSPSHRPHSIRRSRPCPRRLVSSGRASPPTGGARGAAFLAFLVPPVTSARAGGVCSQRHVSPWRSTDHAPFALGPMCGPTNGCLALVQSSLSRFGVPFFSHRAMQLATIWLEATVSPAWKTERQRPSDVVRIPRLRWDAREPNPGRALLSFQSWACQSEFSKLVRCCPQCCAVL